MTIETEIKFTVPEKSVFDHVASLREIAVYRTEDHGIVPHTDAYFDTADFRLYREKIVFRLRTTAKGSVLTFKAGTPSVDEVYHRIEVETPADITEEDIVSGRHPDFLPLKALHERVGMVVLSKSLGVVNNRRIILLKRGDEAHYELVLDDVAFYGPGGMSTILELEVESRTGSEDDLRRISRWLTGRFDLRPAGPSKYILGMELVGGVR